MQTEAYHPETNKDIHRRGRVRSICSQAAFSFDAEVRDLSGILTACTDENRLVRVIVGSRWLVEVSSLDSVAGQGYILGANAVGRR